MQGLDGGSGSVRSPERGTYRPKTNSSHIAIEPSSRGLAKGLKGAKPEVVDDVEKYEVHNRTTQPGRETRQQRVRPQWKTRYIQVCSPCVNNRVREPNRLPPPLEKQ